MRNIRSILMVVILAGSLPFLYQNCSGSMPDSMASSNSSAGSSSGGQTVTRPPLTDFKVYAGPSPNGPWTLNGFVCRGQIGYFKITGAKHQFPPRGCSDLSPALGCLDITRAHHDYQPQEWVGDDIISSITAAETLALPLGEHSVFFSYSDATSGSVQKSGTLVLTTCSN